MVTNFNLNLSSGIKELIFSQQDRNFSQETNTGNWNLNTAGLGTLTFSSADIGGTNDRQALLTSNADPSLSAFLDQNDWRLKANTTFTVSAQLYVPVGNTLKDVHLYDGGFDGTNVIVSKTLVGDTWTELKGSFDILNDLTGWVVVSFDGDPDDTDLLYFDDISIKQEVLGPELYNDDLTNGWSTNVANMRNVNTFQALGNGGVYDALFIENKTYKIVWDVTISIGGFTVNYLNDAATVRTELGSGITGSIYTTYTDTDKPNIYFRGDTNLEIIDINSISIKEVL